LKKALPPLSSFEVVSLINLLVDTKGEFIPLVRLKALRRIYLYLEKHKAYESMLTIIKATEILPDNSQDIELFLLEQRRYEEIEHYFRNGMVKFRKRNISPKSVTEEIKLSSYIRAALEEYELHGCGR